ncbi:hypothetical protein [Thiomicrorhabdus sp.]|uniref:hypothetical protein n=1 Tax=Thiomicrorhabdus sp. TaxID=2039724 RepID=UPI002AA6F170|nr:hypothetical protein [Thiomicrorhabdus sp.]
MTELKPTDLSQKVEECKKLSEWTCNLKSLYNNNSVSSIKYLSAIDPLVINSVNVNNYREGLEGGGGMFYWNASKDKTHHNGSNVIDPLRPFPTNWEDEKQVFEWLAKGEGFGCWIRQKTSKSPSTHVFFKNTSEMIKTINSPANIIELEIGDICTTGSTKWKVVELDSPFSLEHLKPLDDVYVEDFNDGVLSQSEYISKAHNYCMLTNIRARLVFDEKVTYAISPSYSFTIYVESGGWYCSGNCHMYWTDNPTQGFAIKVRGRYTTSTNYSTRVNDSNYKPLEGFTFGQNGIMRSGSGLQIGHANARQSTDGVVVTSKFIISRVNVIDFDDVIDLWNGSWAFELHHVNTIGGSWRTPSYFRGIDFGENIKLNHCFIADNHKRIDGGIGKVVFSAGEYYISGGSFDNMRVVVEGDSNVKMFAPHFENPASTAKNKRFLEVTGNHASCVLDNPTIVIRNTDIYSTMFYCKAGTGSNKHAWSGGLTLNNPQYQAVKKYRPDLALVKSKADRTTYEGDGYQELVGGGGRVYLTGQAYINSMFQTFFPIPISRSLVGRSLDNCDFEMDDIGSSPSFWTVNNTAPYSASAIVSDDYYWVGTRSLKTICDYDGDKTWNSSQVEQEINCNSGNLVLAFGKVKWVTENTNGSTGDITGKVTSALDFYDANGKYISTGGSTKHKVLNSSTSSYDGWIDIKLIGHAPTGTRFVRLNLISFSTSKNPNKKIVTYWDSLVLNVI